MLKTWKVRANSQQLCTVSKQARVFFFFFVENAVKLGSLTAGVGGECTCGGGMEGVGEKFQSAPRVHTAFISHGLVIKVCFEAW